VLIAGVSMANVPSSTNSDQPGNPGDGLQRLRVIGHNGVLGDIDYPVVYRIMDGQPVPAAVQNSVVILNFSACPDVRICQTFTTGTVNCGAKTVTGVTNATGHVTFNIVGAGSAVLTNSIRRCATVTADGVPMNPLTAVVADINGTGGIEALDISGTFGDRVVCGAAVGCPGPGCTCSGTYRQRSDHDDSGHVDALDISAEFGIRATSGAPPSATGRSAQSCAAASLCP
jgi:hypothetical protein